jgi:hypothetical protein
MTIKNTPSARTLGFFTNRAQPLFNEIDAFLFNVDRAKERDEFTYLMTELPDVVNWLAELGTLGRNATTLANGPLVRGGEKYEPEGLYLVYRRARYYTRRLKTLIRQTARFFVLD